MAGWPACWGAGQLAGGTLIQIKESPSVQAPCDMALLSGRSSVLAHVAGCGMAYFRSTSQITVSLLTRPAAIQEALQQCLIRMAMLPLTSMALSS